MKLHLMPQRSPKWHEVRKGLFTASELGPFIYNTGKVAETARRKLIDRKLGVLNGDEDEDNYQSDAMKRGTALEPIARRKFAELSGFTLAEAGLMEHDTLMVGASPDSLIMADGWSGFSDIDPTMGMIGGCEIKCPTFATQIRYLTEGILPPEYEIQIHTSMVVSGCRTWDFFSWSPVVTRWTKNRDEWIVEEYHDGYLPPFHIRTEWSTYTDQIERGLRDLCVDYELRKAELAKAILRPIHILPLQ